MTKRQTASYGAWRSPISAELLAAGARSFQELTVDQGDIYWIESRPAEGGRYVVMQAAPGSAPRDITPSGFSARTLVNSYGGGAFAVDRGRVLFTNFALADFPQTRDQRIHRQDPGGYPQPITPRVHMRYADFEVDRQRGLAFCVAEDSNTKLNGQDRQTLVAVDLDGQSLPITIAEGADFYSSPRLSPDGSKLAYICWMYPSMPWEGTELYVLDLDEDGRPLSSRKVAGMPAEAIDPDLNPVLQRAMAFSDECVLDPRWSPEGVLYFVSDRTVVEGERWWNLHRETDQGIVPVTRMAAEFAAPPWQLGGGCYGFLSETEVLSAFSQDGTWRLARIDAIDGTVETVDVPYSSISHLSVRDGTVAFIGGRFDRPGAIVRCDPWTFACEELRSANPDLTDEVLACVSPPRKISFATGKDGTETAHGFHYAPSNPDYAGPDLEKPPLLIVIHGGPTASASSSLNLSIQYFTSRGFAVVDVNYRGSTGFGRRFRRAMYGHWGDVDVADCVAAARALAAQGHADPNRIASRGGSSGGYTTLALATFTDLLSVAASYYGISNLEMIATDTDKLEAHYAELLLGPWPQAQKMFKMRSPLFHVADIDCPLILFQGLDDPVVPPAQARVMIDALNDKGLPVASTFYQGESHGFRKKATIVSSLEQELAFYGRMLGFEPAGKLAQPQIENVKS